MIQRLVAFAIKMPFIVLATATVLVIAGLTAYSRLDIEAYPNPVPPLVEVITQPEGYSAEEVERYVTIPLEIGLAGMRQQHLEGAAIAFMRELAFEHVEAELAFLRAIPLGRDELERCLRVDEPADQPGRADAIDMHVAPGDPGSA